MKITKVHPSNKDIDYDNLLEAYPLRSPAIIVEVIKDIITDKTVCDLGCGAGDNLFLMSKYAKEIVGVERNPHRITKARKRGFNVIEGNFLEIIPIADVYYIWTNITLQEQLIKIIKETKTHPLTIITPTRLNNGAEEFIQKWDGYLVEYECQEPKCAITRFDHSIHDIWQAAIIQLNH